MGPLRKILLFVLITSALILLGRMAGRFLPPKESSAALTLVVDGPSDSTNALPELKGDTTVGRWREKLFLPLARSFDIPDKSIRKKVGSWELILPKGKPIHEYALSIERLCVKNGIKVVKGVELRPSNRAVEYILESEGGLIKLRASLGKGFMAGSARLAIVFTNLDSLRENQLAALEAAPFEKTLIIDPHGGNPVLKKVRFTSARNELLAELPMEPSSFPYVDPGKQALFIHHGREDVDRILQEALDSLPKARGFASKFGDRAIENPPLLDKVFRFTSNSGLVFLDLTGSPRSLTRQVAGGMGARYRLALVDKDGLGVAKELGARAALAQKTGEAIWVLHYTPSAFRALEQALEENEGRMAETGLELVTVSRLSGAEHEAAQAAKAAAQAKKKPEARKSAPRP